MPSATPRDHRSLDPAIAAARDEILRIARGHGVEELRVFGSAARGQLRPESDIDFLVTARGETSAWFPAGLIQELERLLHRKVDVVTETSLHWYIRDRVIAEAVEL